MKKIRVLRDRVLLKRIENVTKSSGGLFLPDQTHSKSNQAVVAAVGEGMLSEDGTLVDSLVAVGDHVVAAKHAGQDVKVNGEEFWLVRENDIMYVVEHEEDQ
jgi:chaperonin GroES